MKVWLIKRINLHDEDSVLEESELLELGMLSLGTENIKK